MDKIKRQTSTEITLATIVLGFEVVVVFLTGLTIFGLKLTAPPGLALIVTGVALLGLVFAMATMRRGRVGIISGWILHALYFLPILILPSVGILAIIFGALWVFAVLKGRTIDRMRESHTFS
ncbi:MAG TPA: DUF4233 domain-containing protein [Microbacteriaceae bacterium]|nr:DUF4233 domain-containing protein [Microbacteriaceae bacterium]